MKTPEQIREYLFGTQLSLFTWVDIDRAIKQAQIEAYNEGIESSSQKAYNFIEFYQEDKCTMEAIKQSILKLKK